MSQSARLETHASIQSFEELQRKLQEENSSILHERTMATRDAALSVAIRKTEDLCSTPEGIGAEERQPDRGRRLGRAHLNELDSRAGRPGGA